MKLDIVKPNVETSAELESKFFSIGDHGVIFDILRNKIYSDPIRSICREISCNARDSHREAHRSDVPIEIQLPNYLEPFYKIKDFGVGISPDRIENIFIKYGASTKRNDNTLTGAYGIGSKSIASYSSEYTIETIFDGIKYNYVCFVDETRVGKITLMDQFPTDEHNGTTIIIPVKPQDQRKFIEDTEYTTRHWDVKPIINGATFKYQEINPTLKGKHYAICQTSNNSNYLREIRLIIDGIEYPLEYEQIKSLSTSKILEAINGTVYLYFGIGEISLSATRETIHLDNKTKDKISDRFNEIVKDFTIDIQKKIDDQPNYWDANHYFNYQLTKSFTNINFVGKLEWKGLPIIKGGVSIKDAKIWAFTKGNSYSYRSKPDKIEKIYKTNFNFVEDSAIYIDDLNLKEVQVKNVKAAFENDSKLKYLFVIKPNDNVKIEDLIKDFNLEDLGVEYLSDITKVGKTYKKSGIRTLTFKLANDGVFKQVSHLSIKDDKNKKIICFINTNDYERKISLKNGKKLYPGSINSLITSNGASLYAVDTLTSKDKIEKLFPNVKTIDDFLDEKVLNSKIDFVQIKYTKEYEWDKELSLRDLKKNKPKIKNKNSLYIKLIDLKLKIEEINKTHKDILSVYEEAYGEISKLKIDSFLKNNSDFDYENLKKEVNKKYPLLQYISSYYSHGKLDDDIVDYINIMDAKKKI